MIDCDELATLRQQVATLRRELRNANEGNAKRNRQLDLLGMVWCDGGCDRGMARFDGREVTAADVALLLVNAERARHWYVARAGKAVAGERQPAWDKARAEIEAALPPFYRNDRASIVAYVERVAAQQQGYTDRAGADLIYRGRLSMRAFMARALAKRIARCEDRRSFGAGDLQPETSSGPSYVRTELFGNSE